jgi:hypothetical protein
MHAIKQNKSNQKVQWVFDSWWSSKQFSCKGVHSGQGPNLGLMNWGVHFPLKKIALGKKTNHSLTTTSPGKSEVTEFATGGTLGFFVIIFFIFTLI